MFAELIRLLIAAACALFVLSLPLWKTTAGATLRRWAGVCFVLAFLPSILVGLFYAQTDPAGGAAAPSPPSDILSGLGCVAAAVFAAFIAYGILKLRNRFLAKSKPRDPWETFFKRGGGKRPFHLDSNAQRPRGPFSFGDED